MQTPEKIARGGAIFLTVATSLADVACSQQLATATSTPKAIVAAIPTPDYGIKTVSPTVAGVAATPEATATSAPATETQVSPTPTGTVTREASPTTTPATTPTKAPTKEAEKPPLPEYTVFTGSLLNKDTKAPMGTIMVSQLPKSVNQIFIYYLAQRSGRPFLINPKYIAGRTVFENAESRYEYVRIDASKPDIIFGALEGGDTRMTFTAPVGGQGRNALIQIYKQIKIKELNLGPGGVIYDESVIKELAKDNITLP